MVLTPTSQINPPKKRFGVNVRHQQHHLPGRKSKSKTSTAVTTTIDLQVKNV
jgi:hypothetical protein